MNGLLVIAAILAGLAIGALVWGGRGLILGKFRKDVRWMRETYLRFNPEPINAELYTWIYYASYAALLAMLLAIIPNKFIVLGFWFFSMLIPKIVIEMLWRARIKKIDLQISQCVTSMANSMRAGLTLVQAITRLSEQAPDPIKAEFKIMSNQYGYGADMDTVLKNAKERLGLANFNLFASALLLNREMGGDISETLTRISKSLDKLREMRKTVEAHTSEGRTNIKVLLIAPVFMLLMLGLVDSQGVMMLFTTTPGWAILIIAGVLAGSGAYIAHRITKSEI